MKRPSLLCLCLLLLAGCGDAAPRNNLVVRPVKIAIVQATQRQEARVFPGVTEATRKSDLAFRVGGQVVEVPVRAGQFLAKGTLIARLDDSPYQNTLMDRQAKYDLAKIDHERQRILYDKKQVAKSRLDSAVSTFEAAQASLKQAEDDLSYTRLLAPYDGILGRIDLDPYQNVAAQQVFGNIQALDTIDIAFSIPESLFRAVNKTSVTDQTVSIRFDIAPERLFTAHYYEHETMPDTNTRSYKIKVSMPRPDDLIVLPGMSANVIVDLADGQQEGSILTIPLDAVFEEGGQTYVWRLSDDNIATRQAVQVDGIENESARITTGLAAGDRIIAAGTSFVQDGMKVRPLTKERGI